MSRTLSWSVIGADLAALKIERSLRSRTCGDIESLTDLRSIVLECSTRTIWPVGGACTLRGPPAARRRPRVEASSAPADHDHLARLLMLGLGLRPGEVELIEVVRAR